MIWSVEYGRGVWNRAAHAYNEQAGGGARELRISDGNGEAYGLPAWIQAADLITHARVRLKRVPQWRK